MATGQHGAAARPAWPPGDSDMAARIRAHDWGATPLGPSADWPLCLKVAVELVLASPQIATVAVGPSRILLYNDAVAAHYGGRHPGVLGQPLPESWPTEFPRVAPFYDRVFAGESVHVPAQPLDPAGAGEDELFDAYLVPVRSPEGTVIAAHMTGFAVGARLRAEAELRDQEARLQVMVAELQHRVRNMLTVVRSVFARTVERGGDLQSMADHFRGRLDALARTQVVATQNAGRTVDLEQLIRDELLSVGASDGPTLLITGPEVALPSRAAESIGLAVHELTTNAIKYGALKTPGGILDIRWSVTMEQQGRPRLELRWTEMGVPAVAVRPVREGFGRELIEEALPYRLGAETTLEFRGGGVRCFIALPLAEGG